MSVNFHMRRPRSKHMRKGHIGVLQSIYNTVLEDQGDLSYLDLYRYVY